MAESAEDTSVFWVDPETRGIIPLDKFHVSKSLRKRLLSGKYEFTHNSCFELVLDACANRDETWINPSIRTQYTELNRLGFAHSIEVWKEGELAGGLYGVSIGGAFFGESMFSTMTDGSKLALVALIARLKVGGFTLLDTQFLTDHLATMGGVEIARDEFRDKLEVALQTNSDLLELPTDTSPYELWQLSTQTS
jgi:leucyl/phenylalanyl-tRNA--protein transferase